MSSATTERKRKLQFEMYKKLLGYTCAHPDCNSGASIEAHHVRPLKFGGSDAFWNIVCLCSICHRRNGLHRGNESKIVELFVFKAMHESRILGFYCDEQEENFKERFKKAIRESKEFSDEERYIALNCYAK
jgi:hypothetical protein